MNNIYIYMIYIYVYMMCIYIYIYDVCIYIWGFLKWGYPFIAGWFISWNIPNQNG